MHSRPEPREILDLMQARNWRAALAKTDEALGVNPIDGRLHLYRAQSLMGLGLREEAFAAAAAAEQGARGDAMVFDAAGTLYSYGGDQRRALAAYDRAVSLSPRNPQFLYNRATVRRFLGQIDAAEADFDQVIALKPADYEAYKNRSDLRVQTQERNHIEQLESMVGKPFPDWRGQVQICYALAKEYEDLGAHSRSYAALAQGAKKRREHMRYDIATDVATVDWIKTAFPAGPTAPLSSASEEAPIFVMGLPRSGTTLVERILGSHSSMHSAGELDCFALAIVDAVRLRSGPAPLPRRELVAQSAGVDFAALGRDYLQKARAASGGAGRFIDKMPLNYLYCGLIRRALPKARLVHVIRHPMAVCYAMYKTLFKDGYPFTYDLGEIAQYYVAYRALMAHWQVSMPGAIYPISYEALIADQLGETRKLLDYCGLEWQDACVRFQDNPAASTTASAAQVRRPIYESSISQWRHYEPQLAGLRAQLEAAGIAL